MYDKVFKEPPSDLGLIETSLTKVEIPLSDEGVEIFVTIMAYDRHGELVGGVYTINQLNSNCIANLVIKN